MVLRNNTHLSQQNLYILTDRQKDRQTYIPIDEYKRYTSRETNAKYNIHVINVCCTYIYIFMHYIPLHSYFPTYFSIHVCIF